MSSPTADKRRYYLGVPALMTPDNHRRGRSPSRSPGGGECGGGGGGGGQGGGAGTGKGLAAKADGVMPYVVGQRRRQRAQSRSRRHGLEEAFAPGGRAGRSPLVGSGVWTTDVDADLAD